MYRHGQSIAWFHAFDALFGGIKNANVFIVNPAIS
jgi:hypothetical protein